MLFFFSPLEQFETLPIFSMFSFLDLSITNQSIIFLLIFFFFVTYFLSCLNEDRFSFLAIPHKYQSILELSYFLLLGLAIDNIAGKKNNFFFPLIFVLFFFIALINITGLIPFSYTITSHFIVTLSLSSIVFIGLNVISIRLHGLEFFSLFLPGGTSVILSFLLVPVEIISFIFKPLSLAIRLFCNMMAGHTLLKVFVGFSWNLMNASGIVFILHYIPLVILLPLFFLELGVALIQAFVFTLLTCIYINDAVNLH
jgi:ATP synthase subunit 6